MTAETANEQTNPSAHSQDLADAIAAARAAAANGDQALNAGDLAAARGAYEEALRALPNHSELLVKLGNICIQMGLAIPAERAYSVVLGGRQSQIHPAVFSAAFQGLLQSNLLSGQHERNTEMLTRNTGSFAPDRSFLDMLALSLVFTGNLSDLASYGDAFLQSQPRPLQLPQLALALIQAGQAKQGLELLAEIVRDQPGDPGLIALMVRAVVAAGMSPTAEADLAWLGKSGTVDPGSVFALYQLGRYRDISDRLDGLEREPDYPVHHDYNRPVPISTGRSRLVYGRAYDRLDSDRWVAPTIDAAVVAESVAALRKTMRALVREGVFEAQLRNIAEVRQRFASDAGAPVQILSTGRCGTRALYFLLRQMTSVLPFHSAQFATVPVDRNHLLYRLLTGTLDREVVAEIALTYLQSRTAEIMVAYRRGKTPILVTHWDTVFGAVNAELFPDMRFLYMHRRPEPVFKSMFGKNQWQNMQLMHLLYDRTFPGGNFRARLQQDLSPEQRVSWYLHITRVYARCLLADLGPERGLDLESESMFAASDEAFETLSGLIPGWDLDKAAFAAHFGEQRNTKDDLLQVESEELDRRAARVPEIMAQLEAEGRF